ncbi:alpha-methylacyl racemase [Fusarium coicis]|nr:alpha-methylacyl racemase [Fusarium coicis]
MPDYNQDYSVPDEAAKVFREGILTNPLISKYLPPDTEACSAPVTFSGFPRPSIPLNWRVAESLAALKGLEATLINVLLKRKYGVEPQEAVINTDHAALFLLSTMFWTLDPEGESLEVALMTSQPDLLKYFPTFEYYHNASVLNRGVSSNLYKCADGKFYHLHGSLNPTKTIEALGLEQYTKESDYDAAVEPYMKAVAKYTSSELHQLIESVNQAGCLAQSIEEFAASEQGKSNAHVGLFEVHDYPNRHQKASWWPASSLTSPRRPLAGLKVVDLSRIIAAPTISRGLAELGASVMHVSATHLPDAGWLHADLNWGKWTTRLDLREEGDRAKLSALVLEADVVVSGYRPGVLAKYGFGCDDIIQVCAKRDRGIIVVRENCYGWYGPDKDKGGWQQLSDAQTGVSLSYGQAMGLDEPVTPPFPNSDYSAGVAGILGTLVAILRRGESGGSYMVDTSMNYYNQWLIHSVGTYPDPVFQEVWNENGREIFRHYHGMLWELPHLVAMIRRSEAGKRILAPEFFEDRDADLPLKGKGRKMRMAKPMCQFPGGVVQLGFDIQTRTLGVDKPRWPEDLTVQVVT